METTEIYEKNKKKYTVITKCKENPQSIEKLYDILCQFIIEKLQEEER